MEKTHAHRSANPAALGLMGFGMTTVLVSLHNAGTYELGSMILAMGIFYGGLAQIIAGLMEWKKGNTFEMTAFISFGLFWLTFVGIIAIPEKGWAMAASGSAMGAFFILWGVFTSIMFIGYLKLNKALRFIFASLALLFFLLAATEISGLGAFTSIAGYVGIICGVWAMYTASAQVVDEVFHKKILPL